MATSSTESKNTKKTSFRQCCGVWFKSNCYKEVHLLNQYSSINTGDILFGDFFIKEEKPHVNYNLTFRSFSTLILKGKK